MLFTKANCISEKKETSNNGRSDKSYIIGNNRSETNETKFSKAALACGIFLLVTSIIILLYQLSYELLNGLLYTIPIIHFMIVISRERLRSCHTLLDYRVACKRREKNKARKKWRVKILCGEM